MPGLDKRKVQVYDDLNNVLWKFVFSLIVAIAFIVVLVMLLRADTVFDSVKLGAIELFLTGTVYVAFKHYFPNRDNPKEKEKAPAA
ncbi:hypothetical protein GCM10027422_28510 [Hymenobacter arcticus]